MSVERRAPSPVGRAAPFALFEKLSFRDPACYTRAMKRTLKDVAEALGVFLIGDGRIEVTGVASLQSANPGDLVFVEDAKNLPQAFSTKAVGVIAGEFAVNGNYPKPV